MLITTFKQDADLYNRKLNPFVLNMAPTLEHLRYLFTETLFVRWLLNTALVGVMVVTITLVLAIPAAYSLVRLGGRLGERLGIGIFLTYLVAPTILFIPMSRVVVSLGLQDSLWSLVVVFPSFTVPFAIWLLMGFFKSIPPELEEAAMIDGYGYQRSAGSSGGEGRPELYAGLLARSSRYDESFVLWWLPPV